MGMPDLYMRMVAASPHVSNRARCASRPFCFLPCGSRTVLVNCAGDVMIGVFVFPRTLATPATSTAHGDEQSSATYLPVKHRLCRHRLYGLLLPELGWCRRSQHLALGASAKRPTVRVVRGGSRALVLATTSMTNAQWRAQRLTKDPTPRLLRGPSCCSHPCCLCGERRESTMSRKRGAGLDVQDAPIRRSRGQLPQHLYQGVACEGLATDHLRVGEAHGDDLLPQTQHRGLVARLVRDWRQRYTTSVLEEVQHATAHIVRGPRMFVTLRLGMQARLQVLLWRQDAALTVLASTHWMWTRRRAKAPHVSYEVCNMPMVQVGQDHATSIGG